MLQFGINISVKCAISLAVAVYLFLSSLAHMTDAILYDSSDRQINYINCMLNIVLTLF